MNAKLKQKRLADIIGIACGVFVLLVGIVTGIVKSRPATVGANAGDIPASAQHLTGTAEGRNGPITVEIIADENKIYHPGQVRGRRSRRLRGLPV